MCGYSASDDIYIALLENLTKFIAVNCLNCYTIMGPVFAELL